MKRYWRLNLGAAVFLLAGLAFCRTAAVKAETNETEGKQVKIEELDPNMADKPVDENGMIWFTPDEKPFELLGFYWYDQDKVFRRLPVKPDVEISEGVDYLANHTAGGQIRFRSDCRKLVLKADLGISEFMPHMAPTGSSGFDFYIGGPYQQRFSTTARPPMEPDNHIVIGYFLDEQGDRPAEMRDFTINLPLYNQVKSIRIGLDAGSRVMAPQPYVSDRPVIVYGTSITQGGCASRPGSCYTNILSRKLNRPFLNYGFSGNGKGEPEMAQLLAEIADPAMLILDYQANCVDMIDRTLPEFIRIYREKHPEVPILVVSGIRFSGEAVGQRREEGNSLSDWMIRYRDIQKNTVEACRAAGDRNIYFLDGSELLDPLIYDEATVDGVHPTDLGFTMMADGMAPVIRKILDGEAK